MAGGGLVGMQSAGELTGYLSSQCPGSHDRIPPKDTRAIERGKMFRDCATFEHVFADNLIFQPSHGSGPDGDCF
jgi:hypothetical protein